MNVLPQHENTQRIDGKLHRQLPERSHINILQSDSSMNSYEPEVRTAVSEGEEFTGGGSCSH